MSHKGTPEQNESNPARQFFIYIKGVAGPQAVWHTRAKMVLVFCQRRGSPSWVPLILGYGYHSSWDKPLYRERKIKTTVRGSQWLPGSNNQVASMNIKAFIEKSCLHDLNYHKMSSGKPLVAIRYRWDCLISINTLCKWNTIQDRFVPSHIVSTHTIFAEKHLSDYCWKVKGLTSSEKNKIKITAHVRSLG